MRNKKLIIFDIDDTLIFTYKNIYFKSNIAFKNLWIESLSYDKFIDYYRRNTFLDYVKKMNLSNSHYNSFLDLYKKAWNDIWLKSIWNIKNLIFYYINQWYDIWIITNWFWISTYKKLTFLNINPFIFKFILHADNLKFLKPSNNIFNMILKNELIKYSNVYYIWDWIIDYKSTINTKVEFIGVLTWLETKQSFNTMWVKNKNIICDIMALKNII